VLAVVASAALTTVGVAWAASATTWSGMSTNLSKACDRQELVQPFGAFGDTGNYVWAPNGGLESRTTGWALTGSAAVVPGNEPFYVHGKTDSKSLSIPVGSTATTPAICFGALYPWTRLFVNGPAGSSLRVDLKYVDTGGVLQSATLATLTGAGEWQLSPRIYAASFLVSSFSKLGYVAASGERYSAVAYTFTPTGGAWLIDDVYVDPFKFR
jgi:hypothetical protein